MTDSNPPAGPSPPAPLHGLSAPLRFPWGWALMALPVAFVASQLVGAVARGIAETVVGAAPPESVLPLLAGVAGGHGTLLLLVWILVTAVRLPRLPTLGLVPREKLAAIRIEVWAAAAVGTFMLGPLADTLMSLMERWAPSSTLGSVPMLQEVARDNPMWLTWPFLALVPGLAEELFFRGLLQRSFARPAVGAVVSAVAFAAFHVDPHHVVGVLPLGAFLAWIAMHHGTSVAIAAHVANNSVALLSARNATLDVGYGTDQPMPLTWLPISLWVVVLCARVLSRNARHVAEAHGD